MPPNQESFVSHDGLRLFEQSWLPVLPARAAVIFIHGLIEHSGRHAQMAGELVRRGYSVHAMDLRGHGLSEGPRCDVPAFDDYLLDLDVFFQRVREREGERPLFLMGNSMGGLIISLWFISRQARIGGLILSGALLAPADGLFPRLRRLAGLTAAVLPALRVTRIPFSWLARTPEMVESYRRDPLMFHGRFTIRVAAESLGAMRRLADSAAEIVVPLLILHGGNDRICGPAGAEALYRKAGSADKTLHLYEGFYHEVFDEPERERVLTDLTTWLDGHAPPVAAAACKNRAET